MPSFHSCIQEEGQKSVSGFALSQLKLADYRNYVELDLEVGPGPVVITGANGAGKTNLIEAISILAPGRGLRRAGQATLAREGSSGAWAVHAKLSTPSNELEIGTGQATPGTDGGGRKVRINRTRAAVAELSQHVALLWLTPSMDGLFVGPASDRRRFLDRLTDTFEAGHGGRVQDHEKLVRSRNKILVEPLYDAAWLGVIEGQIAELAIAIAYSRVALIDALNAAIKASPLADDLFPSARLKVLGAIEEAVGKQDLDDIEAAYRERLVKARPVDQAAGRTLDGVHRSDLEVRMSAEDRAAALGSTGQQKAVLISILMAEAELIRQARGGAPILLLDEVAAHLDPVRRAALFAHLEWLELQSWMTGTEPGAFSALGDKANWLTVANALVTRG